MSNMDQFTKESWGVHPILDVPDLFPPALMFGILDSDPRLKYREMLQRMSEKQHQQQLEPAPPLTPQLLRQLLLSAAWDSLFHDVPGDKMSLLCQDEAHRHSSKASGPERTYSVAIKSTKSTGTRWLVTRAAMFEKRAVCWCIAVDTVKGETAQVVLTKQNMITLEMT